MYSEYEIRQIPLSLPRQRRMVEAFLHDNALRLDADCDYYAGIFRLGDDAMLAGGGLHGATIKCLAVRSDCRDEALACRMVSHLVSVANANGHQVVRLFTKPSHRAVFESMSFRLLAEAPEAILMETGVGGIDAYCRYLRDLSANVSAGSTGEVGVIVMNANPFTLGHRYLVEQAAQRVAHLYVIAVKEEASLFAYEERMAMLRAGLYNINNVSLCSGSDYAVSATTFPTYFLKRLSDASPTQMTLDIDLFRRHIMPALGASVRFVGSEPTDALTRRYNETMVQMLPRVVEIDRLTVPPSPGSTAGDAPLPVSASLVREAMRNNRLWEAASLVPPPTVPYILAHLATQALQTELDLTPKPGLVDRHDSGAHKDMDYALMCRSIRALHPFFGQLALMGFAEEQPSHGDIVRVGQEAERAMLRATAGVNTHKGALFSLGLAVVAAAREAFLHGADSISAEGVQREIMRLAADFPDPQGTHGSAAKRKAALESGQSLTIKGALDNAREGYALLFSAWLPYWRSAHATGDAFALHRTLLRIVCDLDDTNIIFRAGTAAAARVKEEAHSLLAAFSEAALHDMNTRFTDHNISPGGSADMLSLTLFIDSVCIVGAHLRGAPFTRKFIITKFRDLSKTH
jgi:[citrate (pro-3S)-lyase] ligase